MYGMIECNLDFDFCEHCIYGKHNRVRFEHSDVFGPVHVLSLGRFVYSVCLKIISQGTHGFISFKINQKYFPSLKNLKLL